MSQFQSEVNSVYSTTLMQIERGTHKPIATIAKVTGSFEVNAGEFHEDELPDLSENDSDSDSEYNLKVFETPKEIAHSNIFFVA